ncbi:MAG TPA: hypothetical protein VHF69_01050, partial [Candidatus Synoicihabitans sp.]|nr:hypothetical protein [Candidatus Synoicihabitans sp.]
PVRGVSAVPVQLAVAEHTFAVLGTKGELYISVDGDTWIAETPLAGARVVGMSLDESGGWHAAVQVPDGVQRYYSFGEHWYPLVDDTLLRPSVRDAAATITGFVTVVDTPANTPVQLAFLRQDGWEIQQLGMTQAIVDAYHDGHISYLVTAGGEVLAYNQARWWRIFSAPDLKLRTVFSTGGVVIAGGARGEIVLCPAQVPDEDRLVATTAVPNLPPGVQLAGGAEAFKARATDRFQRVVSAEGGIYGLTEKGQVHRWTGARFEPAPMFSDLTGVTDLAGAVHELRALAGTDTHICRGTSRSTSTHSAPKLQRLFTGLGRWLLLWEGNLAADTHSPNIYSKMELAKDFVVRDAAYAMGHWVIVGAQADGTGGVITSKSRRWFDAAKPTNTPALNAITHDGTRYIAVGDGGVVVTSPNGQTWETRSLPGAPKLIDVACGAGRTVALTADGTVYSLEHGKWQPVLTELKTPFRHLAGTPQLLVVAGERTHVTWSAPADAGLARGPAAPLAEPATHVAIPGENVHALVWDGKQFVAATDNLL